MGWTREQQKAIDERNKNLLVAAAAGSGKTAVLVERIKKLVLEENVPIDRMLIVTFTNAAAAEMKEKLRKSLISEISNNPENSAKLREQLRLMSRASISTFHAFALDVMRRFFYLIDLEPGFSICDEAERTILKEEAMDELLENSFEEGKEDFYNFLDCYSSDRNLNRIREIIDESYNVLQSLPYPWNWLKEKTEFLNLSAEDMKNTDVYSELWKYIGQSLNKAYEFTMKAYDLLNESGFDRLANKMSEKELTSFEIIKDTFEKGDFNRLSDAVNSYASARLVAGKDEKAEYELIKEQVASYRSSCTKEIKNLKDTFFIQSFEGQVEDINKSAGQARVLSYLLNEYDKIFKGKKQEKKLIDFNDIEHYCLEILHNEQAAEFYKKKFQYIFVDEYQDTNILQEEIISKVKRKNNLFMVGDIKQSIYKFRLAEPEIFKSKYENYKNCTTGESEKIDLNRNFRSKPAILEGINTIFENLMEGYDEDAKLYPGFDYKGQYNYIPEIHVVDGGTKNEADDEIAELKKAEVEALQVCKIIKENTGKIIFDQKMNCERPLSHKDMVILMRGVRNYADIYYNIMKEQEIEGFIDDSESYFDTIEIDIWMKLLSVIDNKMQDIPLISVLHSEIFGFTADELAEIRIENRKGSFAESFIKYAESGEKLRLKEKASEFLYKISEWKKLSFSLPLGKFLWKIMLDSGYYIEMGAMPGGVQRQMNLRALIDKAEKYASERPGSLYNFIKYIETLKHRKVQVGQVKLVGENDNLVRIMTIHKSKGLEFPVVILCGAGKKLNYTKLSKGIVFHKDIGIGMYLVNYNEHWKKQNLLYRLIKEQVHQEEYEEEIRILYVALTRAKDKLYITGIVRDGDKFIENCQADSSSDTNYLSMIGNNYPMKLISMESLSYSGQDKSYNFNLNDHDNYISSVDDFKKKEIYDKLNYTYPYEENRKLKSKYSVSEINRGTDENIKKEFVLSVPEFKMDKHRITAAERGTIYHLIMEKLDFIKAGEQGLSYISERVSNLIESGILLEEEAESVNLKYIEGFFKTELGKRCIIAAKNDKLYKERSFNLKTELNGEEIIVQGIIDCFFEENGKIVLMDYKTNWIDKLNPEKEEERLRNTYRKQLNIYKDAIEQSKDYKVEEMYLVHLETENAIKM